MTETNVAIATSAQEGAAVVPSSVSPWWRIADISAFGLWLILVGIIQQHHEPWADESQAWLLARDLELKTLWFHELRYEGTPGLWHTIPTTYFHQGLPLYGGALDLGELQAGAPEYVIVYSNNGAATFNVADPPLRAMGYSLVHFSEGDNFYKRFVFDTASYYIYRRTAIAGP